MIRWLIICGIVAMTVSSAAASDNWPHWRGPHANGTVPDADPPLTWDGPSGKNIRWKAPLVGRGSATPIVWDRQVFIVSAEAYRPTGQT